MTASLMNSALEKSTAGHGGAREGAGRPAFEPTDAERALVEKLAGYGLSQDAIASLVREGVSKDTLRERFSVELSRGKARAHTMVAAKLLDLALAGDVRALVWWTKAQMGWREAHVHELSGAVEMVPRIERIIVDPSSGALVPEGQSAKGPPTLS